MFLNITFVRKISPRLSGGFGGHGHKWVKYSSLYLSVDSGGKVTSQHYIILTTKLFITKKLSLKNDMGTTFVPLDPWKKSWGFNLHGLSKDHYRPVVKRW